MKLDLLSIADLDRQAIVTLMTMTAAVKKKHKRGIDFRPLRGRSLGMIFQKPSTRTSVSFAVAMYQLGGFPMLLSARDLQLQRGEPIPDTARVLTRYLDLIMIRANSHAEVVSFAREAAVPIINGLTDQEHPCQVLADIFTLIEKLHPRALHVDRALSPAALGAVKISYIGDSNNVANSWLLAAAIMGMHLAIASPAGYQPSGDILAQARGLADRSGARITVTGDPREAVADSRLVYTDVWASMGKEAEQDTRRAAFRDFQVNERLLAGALPDAMVMHCLPAKRGDEITAGVIDGPQSVVFDQAENRLHAQKAVLLALSGRWRV